MVRARLYAIGSMWRTTLELLTFFPNKGKTGDTYKIGGFNEWKNIIIVLVITTDRFLGRVEGEDMNLIPYVTDRAGHDMRYAVDSTKLQKTWLGTLPPI